MSSALTLARPYARAAFALAQQHAQLPQWSAQLGFAAQLAGDPRMRAVLGNPGLTSDAAVGLLLPPDAPPQSEFGRFLAVLADNTRLQELPEVAALYEQSRADAEHVIKATITSATPMDAAEVSKLQAALKRRFGRDVEVQTKVDADLIGGAIIDAGEVVIDGSLRSKLVRLETALAQ